MSQRGAYTLDEILSQPSIWADTLETYRSQAHELGRFWDTTPAEQVIFTGCGSTYYLSLVAAALFQALTGVPAQARPGSELALFPGLSYPKDRKINLVAISRSGETTETVEAVRVFHQRSGGRAMAITCDPASTLAREAGFTLACPAAQEKSLAQTRSFSSMALLSQALAAQVGGLAASEQLAQLPEVAERLLLQHAPLAQQLGESQDLQRFFFLGSGYLYGMACEAMLKMKEMALTSSEAYHSLEFRHGPMSMVAEQTLVAGLISEETLRQESAVLTDMHRLGAQILAISESGIASLAPYSKTVSLASGLPAWSRPVLYLPVLQLLAYHRAMARGLDPDRPANLSAVIRLESLR